MVDFYNDRAMRSIHNYSRNMPEVEKSGELEFKPYADGYFGEVAGIAIGITGGNKASVGSKDIFRIGYAASEKGHAQRKIYGRAPTPVEPVADSRGEIYATVVGCVGPDAATGMG